MGRKPKRPLTAAQRRALRERRRSLERVFIGGRRNGFAARVCRQPTIGGMSVEDFILRNADPIWIVQNEMWELLPLIQAEQNPCAVAAAWEAINRELAEAASEARDG